MKDFCIIVKNKVIPFGKYDAMAIYPFIFIKGEATEKVIRHEKIHHEQQKEMGIAGAIIAVILLLAGCAWFSLLALPLFYWWYGIEYFIRLFLIGDAYRNMSFEQEAYTYDNSENYLDNRQAFEWLNFL